MRALKTGDRVELDGSPLAEALLDVALPVNPGALHVARVLRGHVEIARGARTVAEGESVTLALEPTEPRPLPQRSNGLLRSPWLWSGVGVVVVAGTAGVLCATTICEEPSAHSGTLGSVRLP